MYNEKEVLIDRGSSRAINTGDIDYNDIKLVVYENLADVFINGKWLTSFYVFKGVPAGNIAVAAEFFDSDKTDISVRYEDFSLFSL